MFLYSIRHTVSPNTNMFLSSMKHTESPNTNIVSLQDEAYCKSKCEHYVSLQYEAYCKYEAFGNQFLVSLPLLCDVKEMDHL